jgi:hypothetical protein
MPTLRIDRGHRQSLVQARYVDPGRAGGPAGGSGRAHGAGGHRAHAAAKGVSEVAPKDLRRLIASVQVSLGNHDGEGSERAGEGMPAR